jgi:uncharacterized protein
MYGLMDSISIIILLATGAGAGFISGLVGVGGGFIIVPVQFWLLTSMGVDPTLAIRIAFGTSLAVVLPTALSGAVGHYHQKAVLLKPAVFMSLTGIVGGFLGGIIATHSPGDYLKVLFGFVVLAAALWMSISKYPQKKKENQKNNLHYLLWGFLAGMMSGLVGVGGGLVLVPVLVVSMGLSMHKAVGTSTAMITSVGGISSYIINGLNVPGLPPYSLGYINLLQLAILAGASVPMAQLGVKVAHQLPVKKLKYISILLQVLISSKMIGVFGWLHLPF